MFTEAQLQKGRQTLNLIATRGGFNINWFEFAALTHVPDQIKSSLLFQLHQNYPNPFNNETFIQYEIEMSSQVELSVFDILGNKIKTLVHQKQDAGNYTVLFDASRLSSGIYFCQLKMGTAILTRKMVLAK